MIPHLLLTVMLLALSPLRPATGEKVAPAASVAAASMKGKPVECDKRSAPSGKGVANLPFSHGNRFLTLDDYLAHLKCYAAPIDQPWWREVRPGVYEHVKRMPNAPRETATRAELMKRFGFTG